MKFLWMLKNEFKSSKLSAFLIFAEGVFILVCFCICISLSVDTLSAAVYFHSGFDGNSVKAAFKSADMDEYKEAFASDEIDLAVYVNYYFAQGKDGSTVFMGSYSESAFTELNLSYSGSPVDINKDYGGAVPAMVSRTLSKQYKTGETYDIGGVQVYVCGKLNDKNLWMMSSEFTGENFFMCYDKDGRLSALEKSAVGCGFFTTQKGRPIEGLINSLNSNELVNGAYEFDWRNKMSEDFDRLSGNLIIGILVFLISAVGFCANNVLTIKKNERDYYCQMCTGQKKSSIILLFAARMAVCLIAGVIAVIIFSKRLNTYFGEEIITSVNLLAASGLCVFLCLISSLPLLLNAFNVEKQ